MVKIELDINGISFFVNTTWKTDAVPVVGDIVIVDKESISQFDRVVFLINARERCLFGSSVGKFHTQFGVGLKIIM